MERWQHRIFRPHVQASESDQGFQHAYQINKIAFVADEQLTLDNIKGVLYGFIVVYKQPERKNRDIMPIRLIFDGHGAAD